VSPIFWQFLFAGAVLGAVFAGAGSYLLDVADKSFRTPEEIRRRLGLPIVGHVPFAAAGGEPVRVTDPAGNGVDLDPGLVAFHAPTGPEAEAVRGIRTALYFSTHGRRHKVIQVTSPNMGDGKTTLITNLAVSIAQSGRKVLLIDADLRRPRVHRVFGLAGKVGLAEVIAGAAEADEAVQVTVVPNLSVLPCGRRPPNPAELLTTPRFEDVLDELREAFDYVLVDSPPLLAVSDPCSVVPRVDGVLLTIRVSKNGRPAAERARDMLAGLKANCLGVVVNGVGKQGAMTGYGYDHYRYADEYASGYAAADHDAAAEPQAAIEPSANGHAPHPVGS
jgi:capsular exopolysaccharide synthesis family protein